MSMEQSFWLYLLECENGKLYTGYTKNLAVRYYQHMSGKGGAKYTRSFKPLRIAQCWRLFDNVGTVLKVERFIKKQNKATKEKLVQSPEELRTIISKKLNLDLKLFPFDSSVVEKESAKLDRKKAKNGYNPFAQHPALRTPEEA